MIDQFSLSFWFYLSSEGGSWRTILRLTDHIYSDSGTRYGRILLARFYGPSRYMSFSWANRHTGNMNFNTPSNLFIRNKWFFIITVCEYKKGKYSSFAY